MYDVANQYVNEAVRGGLATLVLFLAIITFAFKYAGGLMREAHAQNFRTEEILAWSLGVTILIHSANFIGIGYFGQITVLWYLGLAMCSGLVSASQRLPQMRRLQSTVLQ